MTRPKKPSNAKQKTPSAFHLLVPAVHDTVVKWVKGGADIEVAAQAAGVSRRSVLRWLKDGAVLRRYQDETPGWEPRGHDVDLLRFSIAVETAQAESEIGDVVSIGMAARDRVVGADKEGKGGRQVFADWRAAAFRIERRDRSRAARGRVAQGLPAVGYDLTNPDGDDPDADNNGIEDLIAALDRMDARRVRCCGTRLSRD